MIGYLYRSVSQDIAKGLEKVKGIPSFLGGCGKLYSIGVAKTLTYPTMQRRVGDIGDKIFSEPDGAKIVLPRILAYGLGCSTPIVYCVGNGFLTLSGIRDNGTEFAIGLGVVAATNLGSYIYEKYREGKELEKILE